MGRYNKFLRLVIVCAVTFPAHAQVTLCPPNIDFEQGSFSGWECRTGFVSALGGLNTLNWTGYSEIPFQHAIVPAGTNVDLFGGFPESCPNGSGFSVKLGNAAGGARAESLTYRYTIPSTVSVFSLFFHYAIVLQNPDHSAEEQPRFRARIFNVTDNVSIDCVNFDFTASSSLPGFQVSPRDASVIYKDWTPITLNLTGYAGKTIELEFITSDCTRNGHFGYAYVDVNSNCNGAISGSSICPGSTSLTLTAPYGFETYEWYSDINFSTVVSSTQVLLLTPPPTVGTVYPVIITPYPSFGCRDTVYATITLAQSPVADAGPDKSVCSYRQVQLGGSVESYWSYSWSPSALVSNPNLANPYTIPGLTGPVTYYLSVVDNITGCSNSAVDSVIVTPVPVDTSLIRTGDTAFCREDHINTGLTLSAATGIQWYQNITAIPGATGSHYDPQPNITTSYWATVTNAGCTDSTRLVTVNIAASPVPFFTVNNTIQCVDIPVEFSNASRIISGDSMFFAWRLSDGSAFDSKNITKTFANTGSYQVILKATSAFGCSDSTSKYIEVIDYCNAYVPSAFSPNNDGKNDVFKPIIYGVKKLHRFSVFDRWGNLVYSTSIPGEGWDGNNKGTQSPSSIYIWLLEYDSFGQANIQRKGTVLLVR